MNLNFILKINQGLYSSLFSLKSLHFDWQHKSKPKIFLTSDLNSPYQFLEFIHEGKPFGEVKIKIEPILQEPMLLY